MIQALPPTAQPAETLPRTSGGLLLEEGIYARKNKAKEMI